MKVRIIAGAALMSLTLASCAGGAAESGSGEEPSGEVDNVSLLLPYPLSLSWTGFVVGQGAGYFADEALTVETEAAEGGGFTSQQIIAGNVPYAMVGGSDAVVAYAKNPSLRVAFCNKHRNIFQLTAAPASGIEDIEGFRGKTLGITEPGGGEVTIVNAILRDAGLEPGEDVELLPIGAAGPQSASAIESGEVDGYASAFPDIVTLRLRGVELDDLTPAEYKPIPGDCLLVPESGLEDADTRQEVVRLGRAWSKGALFTTLNPDAALDLACGEVPEACADEEYAEAYWDENLDYLTAGEGLKPGQLAPEGWEVTARLLYDSGVTSELVDIEPLISGGLIEEVQKEWSDYDEQAVESDAADAAAN